MRKRSAWDRYLAAVQGAGADPAPAGREKVPDPAKAKKRPRRFIRAAGRAAIAATRIAAGLAEFTLWAGMNLVIVLAIVLAAQAAGAKLPPWLIAIANSIQGLLARAAQAIGLGA